MFLNNLAIPKGSVKERYKEEGARHQVCTSWDELPYDTRNMELIKLIVDTGCVTEMVNVKVKR
jgi:hypothetical protein